MISEHRTRISLHDHTFEAVTNPRPVRKWVMPARGVDRDEVVIPVRSQLLVVDLVAIGSLEMSA
jgi:hypothetical protein